MRPHFARCLTWAILLIVAIPLPSSVADEQADEAAIRAGAAAYVEAFNRHDAEAIAVMWATDATYENPFTGEVVSGREEIEKQLIGLFQEVANVKIAVEITAVRFLAPQVALEEGVARVTMPDETEQETRYTSVHVKRDGKWLIGRMTEQPVVDMASNYVRLKDLEWMVGTWVDQDEEGVIETRCQWTRNQNFLCRSFKVVIDGQIDVSGLQLIGWDPVANRIRSWAFDSDGGFAQASWTKRGDSWVVSNRATLPDGRKSASVNTVTMVDKATFTFQSTGRELDGEILPNIDPITVKRKTENASN